MKRPHALYYAATLGFAALDYLLDINVRAAFLEGHETGRFLFYLFLFVCLALVMRFPDKALYIGTLESAITVGALIINFWSRFLLPVDVMSDSARQVVTMQEVVNFLIAGFYGYFAYSSGIKRIKDTKSV